MASSSTMLMMKTNLKTKNNVKRGRTFKTNLTHTFMTKELIFLPLLSAFFIFVWWCSFGLIRCCFHYCHLSFFFVVMFLWLHQMLFTFFSFACICDNVSNFHDRTNFYTKDTTFICYWKLLHQGYHFHMLLKTFTKFYYCSTNLVYKYNSACKKRHF